MATPQGDSKMEGPPPAPTAAGDLEGEKKAAEIAKLRKEAAKLDLDLSTAHRTYQLEKVKAYGTLVTVIIAIVGLFLTVRAQQLTNESDARRRDNDALLAALKQFGDESSVLNRLAAVASLEQYLGRDSSESRDQITQLFVSALEVDKSDVVKSQIRGGLARHPSKSIITALRSRNLALQAALREQTHYPAGDFARWEIHDGVPDQMKTAGKTIEENGKAMLEVLGALSQRDGEVRDLDLSGVAFSMPVIAGVSAETGGYSALVNSTLQVESGMRLRHVDLNHAKLSWLTFKDCRFTDVKLDGARLLNTVFTGCIFDGASTVRDFVAIYREAGPDSPVIYNGPLFDTCHINVTALSPDESDLRLPYSAFAYWIKNSTWQIKEQSADFGTKFDIDVSLMKGTPKSGSGGYVAIVKRPSLR